MFFWRSQWSYSDCRFFCFLFFFLNSARSCLNRNIVSLVPAKNLSDKQSNQDLLVKPHRPWTDWWRYEAALLMKFYGSVACLCWKVRSLQSHKNLTPSVVSVWNIKVAFDNFYGSSTWMDLGKNELIGTDMWLGLCPYLVWHFGSGWAPSESCC